MDSAELMQAISRDVVKGMQVATVLTAIVTLISVLLVHVTIVAAHEYRVLAKPSPRGSHEIPTPRLGGLGAALAFYFITASVLFLLHGLASPFVATIVVGGFWALIGGLLDDVLELNPRWKFLFQFAAAGSAIAFRYLITEIEIPSIHHAATAAIPLGTLMGGFVTFCLIVFWMNAYNFMDGMDGQASLFGVVAALGLAAASGHILYHALMHDALVLMCFIVAGALLGLLWFNYPGRRESEKTFMGDAGSQFFGFLFAVFTIEAGRGFSSERLSAICVTMLLAPFAWDVLYTLVRRLLRGENVLQAHRSHLYQRLLIAGWSHLQVLCFNAAFWFLCVCCALVYAHATQAQLWKIQVESLALEFMVLAAYTIFVLAAEKRKR